MHCLIVFFLMIGPMSAFADYQRHMVQVTSRGLGAGAAYNHTDPRGSSQFDRFNILKSNIDVNYAYTFRHRWQIGGLLSNQTEERSFRTDSGQKGHVSYRNLLIGATLYYNFSDVLMESFYTGLGVSWLNHEEEFSHNIFNYLEDDKNATIYELLIGKRWSLKRWGIENITYSPQVSLYVQRARKDYEDDGLQDSWGVNLDVIKFDVLF